MNETQGSAEALLAAVVALKERAEVAARAAEEASSKANSESGFAYNAKQNSEEHAKAISQVRGAVDAEFAWLTTTKKNAEELAQAVTAAKTSVDADSRAAADARASAEKQSAGATALGERIDAVVAAAEKNQAAVSAALTDAQAGVASISNAKATADASVVAVQALQVQTSESASKVSMDAAAVAKNTVEAKALLATLAEEVATTKAMHVKVTEYESELARLRAEFAELHGKIEGLLPNATSAGLASAFRNQQIRFKGPQRNWLITFVVTIGLLLVAGTAGLPGFWPGEGPQGSWDSILRHFAGRLPLVAPLVWLGIYSGRNYMLALRIEEEYAFKEAVSTAFEGYKREMVGIAASGESAMPPLVSLCENVLNALAQRPGRIYEGRHDDITPLTPLAKTLVDAVESIRPAAKKD